MPLLTPMQPSVKRLQNLIASTEFRFGFILQNRIRCRKMSLLWDDRLPLDGMQTLGLKHEIGIDSRRVRPNQVEGTNFSIKGALWRLVLK